MRTRWIRCFLFVVMAACASISMPVAAAESGVAAQAAAMKDYEERIQRADSLMAAGDYFEAVRQYERASRVAYNNKLDVDKVAFNGKLEAARKARDAKQAATAAPTVVAPDTKSAAQPSTPALPPASGGAALDPMQDYVQTVKYGDDLAAAGESLSAVKAYERARRLAYNNKLAVDGAALEAKMAFASKARDAKPVVSNELVPPPPPIVPHPPGEKSLVNYAPDHPGRFLPWRQATIDAVATELRVTPAEMKDLLASLQRINDVVKKAPLLNPPLGFDVYSSHSLYSFEATADLKKYIAQGLPLRADTFFSFPGYYEKRVKNKTSGEITTRYQTDSEVECGLRFYVNLMPAPTAIAGQADGEGEFFLEPRKRGEIGGLPVYEDTLVIARKGDEPWIPITTRRLLKYQVPLLKDHFESQRDYVARQRKQTEDYLRPEEMAKRRQEEAAVRARGGASAEYNAHHLEAQHRAWEEGARSTLEAGPADNKDLARLQTYTQEYNDVQALLDSGNKAALEAPACVAADPHDVASPAVWKIVAAGAADCRRVVQRNPHLLNPKLPRSAIQILFVKNILDSAKSLSEEKILREDPGNCVAVTKLIRQLDWQAFAGLLEH